MSRWGAHPETVEAIERAKKLRQELLETVERLDEFVIALDIQVGDNIEARREGSEGERGGTG